MGQKKGPGAEGRWWAGDRSVGVRCVPAMAPVAPPPIPRICHTSPAVGGAGFRARAIPEECVFDCDPPCCRNMRGSSAVVRPVPCRNSPQQLVDDDIDGIAEEGNSSLAGSVPSGGVGTAGGRVSVGTVHFCLGFYYVCRPVREAVVDKQSKYREVQAASGKFSPELPELAVGCF